MLSCNYTVHFLIAAHLITHVYMYVVYVMCMCVCPCVRVCVCIDAFPHVAMVFTVCVPFLWISYSNFDHK
jgi:hypothetical protein